MQHLRAKRAVGGHVIGQPELIAQGAVIVVADDVARRLLKMRHFEAVSAEAAGESPAVTPPATPPEQSTTEAVPHAQLGVGTLPGVGKAVVDKLVEKGVKTVGDLAASADPDVPLALKNKARDALKRSDG